MNTGWLLAGFGAPEHDEVALDHVLERAGGWRPRRSSAFRPTVEGAWHTRAAESTLAMPMRPGRLAGHVVGLVGDAPAGEVERHALGRRCARRPRGERRRAPRPTRSGGTRRSPRRRRIGWPSRPSAPQLAAGAAPAAAPTSASTTGSSGVGGVELEQVEAGGAEVHAVDGPVVEPGDAEGAAVARALGQDVARRTSGGRGWPRPPWPCRGSGCGFCCADAVGPPAGPAGRAASR